MYLNSVPCASTVSWSTPENWTTASRKDTSPTRATRRQRETADCTARQSKCVQREGPSPYKAGFSSRGLTRPHPSALQPRLTTSYPGDIPDLPWWRATAPAVIRLVTARVPALLAQSPFLGECGYFSLPGWLCSRRGTHQSPGHLPRPFGHPLDDQSGYHL